MDDGYVHVVHVGVVEEVPVVPAAALITAPAVAEAIVNAAIEADVLPPIAFMEDEHAAVAPAPVAGSPQVARLRGFHPGAGHPIVAIVIGVIPVAGGPDIAVVRTDGLLVNGNSGWTELTDMATCPKEAWERASKTNENRKDRIATVLRIELLSARSSSVASYGARSAGAYLGALFSLRVGNERLRREMLQERERRSYTVMHVRRKEERRTP